MTDQPRERPARGTVIFAPPFAEEMNKSRRMVAQTARLLADDGWRVVRPDLFGCGDSSGDIGDASWSDWIDDLQRLVEGVDSSMGELWLWGLRSGALLIPPLLQAAPHAKLMLWQPALSGSLVLNQFLRLKTVGALAAGGDTTDRKSLLQQLATGESIEVAGYALSARLTNGLEAARFEVSSSFRGQIVWIEIGAAGAPVLSVPATKMVELCRQQGVGVHTEFVEGDQFWQTSEICEVPRLGERTRALMAQASMHAVPPPSREIAA